MSLVDVVARYLLTYLLHSTLLAALGWLTVRAFAARHAALEEAVWRGALLGAFVTAALPASLSRPLVLAAGVPAPAAVAGSPLAAPAIVVRTSVTPHQTTLVRVAPARLTSPAPAVPSRPWSLGALALLAWAAGVAAISGTFAWSYARLRRRLSGRTDVVGESALAALLRLTRRGDVGPVRLTSSTRLLAPVALGLRRPEICVPARALAELPRDQQEMLLAHEVAHIARHDPAWLSVYNLIGAVFFFQPLHWLLRRRLIALSEILCDQWAVARSGEPVALARCLTEVAGWIVKSPAPLAAPGMAGYRSELGRRVERLLSRVPSPRPVRRPHSWAAALSPLVLVAALAPSVSLADKAGDKPAGKVAAPVLLDDQPAPAPARPLPPLPPPSKPAHARAAVPPPPPDMEDAEEAEEADEAEVDDTPEGPEVAALAEEPADKDDDLGHCEHDLSSLDETARGLQERLQHIREQARAQAEHALKNPHDPDVHVVLPLDEIAEIEREAAEIVGRTAREVNRTIHHVMPTPEERERLAEETRRATQEAHQAVEQAREEMRRAIESMKLDVQVQGAPREHDPAALAQHVRELQRQRDELTREIARLRKERDEAASGH